MTYDQWKTRSDLDDREPDPWDDRDLEPKPIDYDEVAEVWMSAFGTFDEDRQRRDFEKFTLEHIADAAIQAFNEMDQPLDRNAIIAALRRQRAHVGVSECDCCGKMRYGCIDLEWMGLDTHACPKCRHNDPGAYGEYEYEDKLND